VASLGTVAGQDVAPDVVVGVGGVKVQPSVQDAAAITGRERRRGMGCGRWHMRRWDSRPQMGDERCGVQDRTTWFISR
jgi:hypothetical protein